MKQTLARAMAAVAFCGLTVAASPTRAADVRVVVRLYDIATNDASARAMAMRAADDAVATAGVAVDWQDCSRGGAAHPCRSVRAAGDLVVRVLPARKAGSNGARVGVTDSDDQQLGFAPVDRDGRATVVATVYYDVVRLAAQRSGADVHALLGRAIAHELGHLLLRAPGHATSGLMRPLWTDAELTENRAADWTFSEAERLRLRTAALEPSPSRIDTQDGPGDVELAGR
jgi:hypothetical protein